MRPRGLKPLDLVLILIAIAWAGGRTREGLPAASTPSANAPRNDAIRTVVIEGPRGYKTVAVVTAAALLVSIAAYCWSVYQTQSQTREVAISMTGGDPGPAPTLLTRYGCGGCHSIPGLPGADGKVGANLGALRMRVFIGGVARNTPDNLIGWIVNPQRFSPSSAMPATGITEAEARDVAAFLYAQ